jgi:hypothetical protein
VRRLQGGEAPQFPDGPVSQTVHDNEHGFIHRILLGEILTAGFMFPGNPWWL